ncbi:MAG: Txe/YoeB family addiction module toxin [Candidatus Omnitrophica bacterium]|nr:Txe/YoeB family addiction module toxin [Candidatus Omnitrophota bacterium]
MSWQIVFTKEAYKDAQKISRAGLKNKTEDLINILKANPYQNPPPYEKLRRDFQGSYSRRINIQHRLIYQVFIPIKTVKIIRMWTHYE